MIRGQATGAGGSNPRAGIPACKSGFSREGMFLGNGGPCQVAFFGDLSGNFVDRMAALTD